jgi:hypothetical protein
MNDDQPTEITEEGTKIWRNADCELHERLNGDRLWYRNGLLHREDGPAIERKDGIKAFWINGKQTLSL